MDSEAKIPESDTPVASQRVKGPSWLERGNRPPLPDEVRENLSQYKAQEVAGVTIGQSDLVKPLGTQSDDASGEVSIHSAVGTRRTRTREEVKEDIALYNKKVSEKVKSGGSDTNRPYKRRI